MAVTRPVSTPTRRELQKRVKSQKGLEFPSTAEFNLGNGAPSGPDASALPLHPGIQPQPGGYQHPGSDVHGLGGFRPTVFPGKDPDARIAEEVDIATSMETAPLGSIRISTSGQRHYGGTPAETAELLRRSQLFTKELESFGLLGSVLDDLNPEWEESFAANGADFWQDLAFNPAYVIAAEKKLVDVVGANVFERLKTGARIPYTVSDLSYLEGAGETEAPRWLRVVNNVFRAFALGAHQESETARGTAGAAFDLYERTEDLLFQGAGQATGQGIETALARTLPGKAGEAAETTYAVSLSSPLGRWSTGEITTEEFVVEFLETVEGRTLLESSLIGLGSPLNVLPMPIFDDLMRVAFTAMAKTGMGGAKIGIRSTGEIRRLQQVLTSAVRSRGRDLLSETFGSVRGRARLAYEAVSRYGGKAYAAGKEVSNERAQEALNLNLHRSQTGAPGIELEALIDEGIIRLDYQYKPDGSFTGSGGILLGPNARAADGSIPRSIADIDVAQSRAISRTLSPEGVQTLGARAVADDTPSAAPAVPGVPYGPSGTGQFRMGAVAIDEPVEAVAKQVASRPGLLVSVRKNIAKTITRGRRYTTDSLAHAQNVQNEINRYVKSARGFGLTASERFGTKMALLRAGVHKIAHRRYLSVTDEMASHLTRKDLPEIPGSYSLRYAILRHHEDILKSHPTKQRAGYTLDSVRHDLEQLREDVSRQFDPRGGVQKPGDAGMSRVIEAAKVLPREYHKILMESVDEGFVKRELADRLVHQYPWYNPVRFIEDQQFEGLEIITKGPKWDESGERILSASDVDIEHLSDRAWDIYLTQENPLTLMETAILRHEQRKLQNQVIKSLVDALNQWEPQNVTRIATLTKQFNMEDTPTPYAEGPDPRPGPTGTTSVREPTAAVFGDVVDVQTKVPRPLARERPRAGGARERPIAGREPNTFEVAYWRNGEQVFYEIPSDMKDSLQTLFKLPHGAYGVNFEAVIRAMQWPKRAVLTVYNPGFMASNFVYETLLLSAVHGILPTRQLKNLARAMKNIFSEVPLIEEMYKQNAVVLGYTERRVPRRISPGEGPGTAGAIKLGPQVKRKDEATFVIRNQREWKRFLRNPITGPFKFLNEVASAFEISSRMSLYETGLERTATKALPTGDPQEAALLAREGMTDFAKHGELTNFLDTFFLYLNPAVQGFTVPVTMLSKRPVQTALTMSLVPAAAFGLYQWNKEQSNEFNNYYDIPLYERLGSAVVMLPGRGHLQPDGSYKPRYFKIVPILRELALLHGTTTHILEGLDNKMPIDMGVFWGAVEGQVSPISTITANASGAAGLGGGAGGWMPEIKPPTEIISTITELGRNKNSFTGKPIDDPRDEDAATRPGLQAAWKATTSGAAIGSFLNITPARIDHIIKSGMGGVVVDGFSGLDMVLRGLGIGKTVSQAVEREANQLLMIREFHSSEDDPKKIRDAQQRYLAGLDFDDYRRDPDVQAAGINNMRQFQDHVQSEARRLEGRERKPWDGIQGRFTGNGGYSRNLVARSEALKALGYSQADTRAAGQYIREVRIQTHQAQLSLDASLDEGAMGIYEWRRASSELSKLGLGSGVPLMQYLGVEFKGAIQRNRLDYSKYIEMVSNYMDRHDVPENRGEFLYMQFRNLEHEFYGGQAGSQERETQIDETDQMVEALLQDTRMLFRRQDEFMDALTPQDRALLQAKRNIYATPKRREYYADMEKLREYWDVDEHVYANIPNQRYSDYPPGEERKIFGQWMFATEPIVKAALREKYPQYIRVNAKNVVRRKTRVLKDSARETAAWNRAHPGQEPRESLQSIAIKWGIHVKSYSPEEAQLYKEMLDSVDLNNISEPPPPIR